MTAVLKSVEQEMLEDALSVDTEIERYLVNFYKDKHTTSTKYTDRSKCLQRFKNNPLMFQIFLDEYNMVINTKGYNDLSISINLPPSFRQKALLNAIHAYESNPDNLKLNWLKTGKLGEMGFCMAINHWCHFWGFKTRLALSNDNLVYNGDGGFDFKIGLIKIDVKFRDDRPASGLMLNNGFIYSDRMDDNTIFVLTTNTVNIKHGHTIVEQPIAEITDSLPIAIVGQISAKQYKKDKEAFNNKWVVDRLNPIEDLFIKIAENLIEIEGLFYE